VGSALCGPRDLIEKARRVRKPLGGGWRQAGILAAGALYALDHHVERLAEDHANAQTLAAAVRETPGLTLEPTRVDTNIVIFRVDERLGGADAFCRRLKEKGVLTFTSGKGRVRLVTHLDISAVNAAHAAEILRASGTSGNV